MPLGARRKAIQRFHCLGRVNTLPGMLARLREGLNERKKKRTKKGRRHVAPQWRSTREKLAKNRIHPYYSLSDGNVKCLLEWCLVSDTEVILIHGKIR